MTGMSPGVYSVAWSPDGKQMCSAGDDKMMPPIFGGCLQKKEMLENKMCENDDIRLRGE